MTAPYLKPCPCGTPVSKLYIVEASTYRWRYVSSDCGCGWMIETGRHAAGATDEEVYALCVEQWNEMPRGWLPT